MTAHNKLLTLREAAEIVGIAKPTLFQHVQRNNIAAQKVGNRWYVTEGDAKWFRDNRRRPGRPAMDSQNNDG